MNAESLRRLISGEISIVSPGGGRKLAPRQHIFDTLLESLPADVQVDQRLRCHREFSIIKRLVLACNAGNLGEADRCRRMLMTREAACDLPQSIRHLLDAVSFPAIALLQWKQGDTGGALISLEHSIGRLRDHHASGVPDAGIAILEQRLNGVRTVASRGEPRRLEAAVVGFLLLLARDSCDDAGTPLRGDAADAAALLDHFAAQAMLKVFTHLDVEALSRILATIANGTDAGTDAAPLRYAATLCRQVMGADGAAGMAEPIDVARLCEAPPVFLIIVDAFTRTNGVSSPDDALSRWLAALPYHSSCLAALNRRLVPGGGGLSDRTIDRAA